VQKDISSKPLSSITAGTTILVYENDIIQKPFKASIHISNESSPTNLAHPANFFSLVHFFFHQTFELLVLAHLVGNPTQTPKAPNPKTPDGNQNRLMKKVHLFG
jgi:hypothetical protein